MADIESLTFDLTDCALQEESEAHRGWLNSADVAHLLRFHEGPPEWPFDLTEPDAAADHFRQQCADNGGVMLAMDVTTVAGVEALRGLFKYRAPIPGSLAMYYVGILWLPFHDCSFQINIEAAELGTTGAREAAVCMIEGDKWPKVDAPPVLLKSMDEFFERTSAAPVRQLPSDEERYDASFPDHPLSKVRRRLADVAGSAQLAPDPVPLMPFRLWRTG